MNTAHAYVEPQFHPSSRTEVDGEASVLALHCSASSGGQWRSLGEWLGPELRVVTPDLLGYGCSRPWHGQRAMTLADEAEAVCDSLAAKPGPWHLVGHSYGGAVALKIAQQRMLPLRSLTLIEPVALHLLLAGDGDDSGLFVEVAAVGNAVRNAVICGDYHGGMAHFVDYWNGSGTWNSTGQETRELLARHVRKLALDYWAISSEGSSLGDCAGVDVPTLILMGERTTAPARRIAELLAQAIASAQLVTLPPAGHMAPLTHPECVNAAVAAHVSGVTEADA